MGVNLAFSNNGRCGFLTASGLDTAPLAEVAILDGFRSEAVRKPLHPLCSVKRVAFFLLKLTPMGFASSTQPTTTVFRQWVISCLNRRNEGMSKREEFISFINTLKTASPTITDEQRKGFLRLGVQQYGLTFDEASDILNASGLVIGERVDYFEILGLSIAEIQNSKESTIVRHIESAHKKLYSESLRAGGRPRVDGRTEEQWRVLLNQARDTLIDPQKRSAYLATLQHEENSIANTSKPKNLDNMVLIPGGEFQMGSNDDEALGDEHPIHTVFLDAFHIDKYPVTNAQYKAFVDANPQWRKHDIPKKYHDVDYLRHWHGNSFLETEADHPVVNVSWYAAMAYAQWQRKRLPTEAEWEKAARGGVDGKKYPWGDFADPTKANYDWNIGETTPVGSYSPNGYDLYDMCGNVWEWCLDAYHEGVSMSSSPRNPISGANTIEWIVNHFTDIESNRVLRGGSWRIPASLVRIANRNAESPTFSLNVIGFRCVWGVTSDSKPPSPPIGI